MKAKKKLLIAQRNEITESIIYDKLSHSVKDPHNSQVLKRISADELKHYHFWKKHTQADVKPNKWMIWKNYFIAKVFGLTFGIKLMERGEGHAKISYAEIVKIIPEAKSILEDEDRHEKELINLIDEERLKYIGSVVLGLNDALMELTGSLAGFTLALQNTRLIAIVGIVTGIAASLSMGASEYLSTKAEGGDKHPLKASVYTGLAYVLTVAFLVCPYLIFSNYLFCLGLTLINAIIVVGLYTFYISVAKDIPFTKRFFEMVCISLSVAALSFGIGYLVRMGFGVDV